MTSFPADHPLRRSNWLWPEFYMELHNHFAQFRWDFELSEVEATTPIWITADKSYRLYVNGVAVCRGPARGYQSHWPVDEYDLTPYLRAGTNWISVEAYQPGCSTFGYLHENYAGLLVATSDEALREAMGEPIMRRSPGHRRQTARYSLQIDFQEHLDLRQDDRAWIYEPTPPEGWVAIQYPPVAQRFLRAPFGRAPYFDVEPRGIPNLREWIEAPQMPTAQASGRSNEGYRTSTNVSWDWIAEGRAASWLTPDIPASLDGDFLALTLPATGEGSYLALAIPASGYVLGAVIVEVEGAAGGEILDFQHDQFFRDGMPRYVEPGDGSHVGLANRLVLAEGANRHEFYHPLGFGYLTLVARDLSQPITVKLAIRRVEYPFEMRGAFETSDSGLNTIYTACRRTQRLCAMDAYMDTPWREQAQWWGDARVQAKNTFYMDGDARLLARGIRSLAGQSVEGLTPGHAPTSAYWCVLPDFALTWIITLWDHYWQTGDPALFVEMIPRVKEVLAYFDRPVARHSSGLLRYDPRYWLFEDWSTLPKEPLPTFLNLWYAYALQRLAALSEVAGIDEGWQARYDEHIALVERHLFDSERQLFFPVADEDAKPFGAPSVHDQTLAMMLGIVPQAYERMLESILLPYIWGEEIEGAKPSAFWSAFTLEQTIARGYVDDSIEFIRRRWTPMMVTGTTWEDFEWTEGSGMSACHAWSAHPSYHFVNGLTGVFQAAAGWSSVRWSPTFVADLERATAVVPTPRGDVLAEWHREDGKVTARLIVPEGVHVETDLPVVTNAIAGGIEYVFAE